VLRTLCSSTQFAQIAHQLAKHIYSVLYAFDSRTVYDSFTSFIRVLPAEGHPHPGDGDGGMLAKLAPRRGRLRKNTNKQKMIKRVKRKIK